MNDFLRETIEGLRASDKYLLSKYFYDVKGDRLFQEIMQLEEYYLSRAETEVFQLNKNAIIDMLPSEAFRLAELGAGDGSKTIILLDALLQKERPFKYTPIDISANALSLLEHNLKEKLPKLSFEGFQAEYFEALEHLSANTDQKLILLFLGSNIGNFRRSNVDVFMSKLRESLRSGDQLILGVDLKKDPKQILSAYNDSQGVTAAFNFNILERINKELGANFNLRQFEHYNSYDPQSGEARSYLLSLQNQEVFVAAANQSFSFKAYEAVHTETSRKYSASELKQLASKHGFKVVADFRDSKNRFSDQIWERL